MIYVSIDIETTGLNPESHQILQIGAVIEDTATVKPLSELPKISLTLEHEEYVGQPTALSMNSWILDILSRVDRLNKEDRLEYRKQKGIVPVGLAAKQFHLWLLQNGFKKEESGQIKITAAGKNFGTFDKLFLQKLPLWSSQVQIKQRVIDPAVLCTEWTEDEDLPNLNTCIKRLGLIGEVTHDAVQDALDVIRVIRSATNNYTHNAFKAVN